MNNIFEYTNPSMPDNCKFIISPSQIGKFFSYPSIWYKENVLKENEFKGNTSTFIGTIVHYIYKCVTENKEINREIINSQLIDYLKNNPNKEVDIDEVERIYPIVAKEVVNSYVIPHNNSGCKISCEVPIYKEIKEGIYLAGTYDRLEGTTICDYKTVSTKPNDKIIPFDYKIQLLAYAYMLYNKGIEIDSIRIIYGIKPTKTIPARCLVVTNSIAYEDIKLIKDTITLISDSILTIWNNPNLTYLIFKSMSLKKEK